MKPTLSYFGALLVVGLLSAPAFAQTGTVTVVHGVPGLTVDVYVNGDLTFEDFAPDTITDPIELPVGDYDIAITAPDADIADAVITGSAALTEGAFVSIVAHLAADGSPTLSLVPLDLTPSDEGSRLTVAHLAAAPAVDISLRRVFRRIGKVEGAENGDSATLDLRAGLYFAKIFPAGSDDAVFGPAKLILRTGYHHVVYAVGSLADETFRVLTQKIEIPPEVPATNQVSVVHGVPGATVDVFVNGALTLDDFTPGTITDPLALPAGDYEVALTGAEGGDPSSPLISDTFTLGSGQNVSIVAHLTEDGALALTAYANDVSSIGFARSRIVVRHNAAAPAVDVALRRWFWRAAKIEGLANPDEAQADVIAGRYSATVFPAGSDDAVLGPARLTLRTGDVQVVYAIGSLADENLGLLVQRIPVNDWRSSLFDLLASLLARLAR